jgi:hypothetical protein
VGHGHDPLGARQGQVTLIATAKLSDAAGLSGARMNPHAHFERCWVPGCIPQVALCFKSSIKRIGCGMECGRKSVPDNLENEPVMRLYRLMQNGMMLRQERGHLSRVLLRQLGAAFDVCKKESDCPGRQLWGVHWLLISFCC